MSDFRGKGIGGPYEPPRVQELGRLSVVTLGLQFSRPDGCSGNVGDKGTGTPACTL